MSEPVTVVAGMYINEYLARRINAMRDDLINARRERDDVTRAAMRLEADLLEAHGLIDALEHRLAEAYAEVDAWNAAADLIGPVGRVAD